MSLPLPLDVPEEALFNAETVSELQELIGPHGWNAQGALYISTRRRAIMISCVLRDEILELSLTQLQGENLAAKVWYVQHIFFDIPHYNVIS